MFGNILTASEITCKLNANFLRQLKIIKNTANIFL